MNILSPMRTMARRVFGDTEAEGQSMVEYSLIFVLMIIVCLTVLSTLGTTIDEKLFQVMEAIVHAMGG
jgi:Flp pilus assembly pilin Flp